MCEGNKKTALGQGAVQGVKRLNFQSNYNMKARNLPVLEVVQRYSGIELRQRGREWWGLCPLHGEKTPSFSINPEKNVWHCYGCGAGGSGVDFVIKLRGLSFRDAAATIEQDFGISREIRHITKTPSQIRYEKEAALARKIEATFDFVSKARRAIRDELKQCGKKIPVELVQDLGRLETIEEELIGGPDRIANGLRLARRWFK